MQFPIKIVTLLTKLIRKMKTRIHVKAIVLVLTLLPILTFGQKKASIYFESKEYNYGFINEQDGPQKCVFTFTNVGTDTLKITAVRPTCGCTASEYTKDPILPGGKGKIEASYNPAGRPGIFNKGITVTTNDPDNSVLSLTIKGEVRAKPKSKADNYPQKIGNLRFKTNHIAFQDVKTTQKKSDTLKLFNEGKAPIKITAPNLPAFLTLTIAKEEVNPEEESYIIVTYDPLVRNDFGYVFDRFVINTNDSDTPEKQLYASANIIQDFSWMTKKDSLKAPQIKFETVEYDFGTVKDGSNVDFSYKFSNLGKSDLKILKVKASCGCTATNPEKTLLKKGESSEIKVTFNSTGRKGEQHKTITIITNDPKQSNIVLNFKGKVE